MKFFEICAEGLVPKFTRAEVRLPVLGARVAPLEREIQFDSKIMKILIFLTFKIFFLFFLRLGLERFFFGR